MTVNEVFSFLQEWCPLSLAMSGDNPGFLVGDKNEKVKKILVALDCTSELIEKAAKVGANLIVTHHPIIYAPLKNVTEKSRVYKLIKNGISVISMHTNLDVAKGGINDCLANALKLKNITELYNQEIDFTSRIGELEKPISAEELAFFVKNTLGGNIRYNDGKRLIKRVAVCGGSGSDMFIPALLSKADALVTADIKHSLFITANEKNFTIIDGGHFYTENLIIEPLASYLKEKTDLEVIASNITPIKNI